MAVTPRRGPRAWRAAAAGFLTAILFVWPLALEAPLLDPDEGLHAAIAREMVERRDWVVPRVLGEPFLDKPILYFWALAASIRLLGPTEVAVRVPGLAFGWLGVVTTWLLARQLIGRGAGALAYPLAATLALPLGVAQAAVHDVALVVWTNLVLLFLWEAERAPSGLHRALVTVAAGLALGLAILTKGLVGVALAGVPFAVWLVVERRLTWHMVAVGAVALGVGLLVALPWYLAMEAARPGYLHYFFVERHLLGFATSTQAHGERPWWYYLPVVVGGGWPWVCYLPFARGANGPPGDARSGLRLAWAWLGVGLVLLSAARSKLSTYALPVMPAIAVLAARAWFRETVERAEPAPRGFGVALWVHAVVGALVLPAAIIVARVEFGIRVGRFWLVAVALAVGYGLMLAAWRAGRRVYVLDASLALAALTFVGLMRGLGPRVAPELSARDLARSLNARTERPAAVWVVGERVGSLLFYLDEDVRRALGPAGLAGVSIGQVWTRLRAAPPGAVVAIAERDVRRLARDVDLSGVPFVRAGRHRVYEAARLRERMHSAVRGGA